MCPAGAAALDRPVRGGWAGSGLVAVFALGLQDLVADAVVLV